METWAQFVIGPVAILVVGWVLDRRQTRRTSAVGDAVVGAGGAVGEVQHQVQNDHSTNLREDLDRLLQAQQATHDAQRRHHDEFRVFKGAALDRNN